MNLAKECGKYMLQHGDTTEDLQLSKEFQVKQVNFRANIRIFHLWHQVLDTHSPRNQATTGDQRRVGFLIPHNETSQVELYPHRVSAYTYICWVLVSRCKSIHSLETRWSVSKQYKNNTLGKRITCFTRENWENGLFGPLGQPSIGQQ